MSRRGAFSKVFARAATGPLNLSVVGAAVVGAVALASWPIAALGGAAYAALVAADVASPGFRRKVLLGRVRPERLPKPGDIEDPDLRELVQTMVAARSEVDQMVAATPERVRRNITGALASLTELEGHAAALVARGTDLGRYLASVGAESAGQELERLNAQARRTTDPAARREYELAAQAAEERQRALADIASARERVLANLSRVAATMRGVPAKLVRMRALDDQASDALSGDVGAELDRMNIDLRAFEQTLESLVPGTPSTEVES